HLAGGHRGDAGEGGHGGSRPGRLESRHSRRTGRGKPVRILATAATARSRRTARRVVDRGAAFPCASRRLAVGRTAHGDRTHDASSLGDVAPAPFERWYILWISLDRPRRLPPGPRPCPASPPGATATACAF